MTDARLAALIATGVEPGALLEHLQGTIDRRRAENRLAQYRPYPKQMAFHEAGRDNRERLLIAANKVGKTHCGAAEASMHLTGIYPDWWAGRRYDHSIRMWGAGVTGLAVRDVVQTMLIGPPEREEEWGTGMIPKRCLKNPQGGKPWARAMGIANLIDSVSVLHVSGTFSTLWLKSYEQGREKWQGPNIDVVWFDEEPPPDIYSEGLTRTNAVADACTYLTFTPLLGMSEVVRMFLMPGSMQ